MKKTDSHGGFAKKVDSFRVRYAAASIGSVFLIEIYARVLQLNMIGGWAVVLGLIHVTVLGFYFLVAFIHKLAMGRWRQLISVAITPFLAFGILSLQVWSGLDPDYLNFVLMRPWYLAQIDQLGEGENAFYAWFWEETGGGIVSREYTVLIYDKTDQIVRSPEDRTPDWKGRVRLFASRSELEFGEIADPTRYYNHPLKIKAKKMVDHFYLVSH